MRGSTLIGDLANSFKAMADAKSTGSSPIPQPPDHLSVLPPDTGEDSNAADAIEDASAEAGPDDVAPPAESTSGED